MTEPMIPGDEVLRRWFRAALLEQCRTPGSREGGLLLGAPIWGQTYIKRFARYCLPSLMAPKNLKVLAGRSRLLLFSDHDGLGHLYELAEMVGLTRLGIVPEYIEIPPDVMEMTRGRNKYLVLGTAQNLLPQIAKRHGMAFHFLMSDHIYAPDYFARLERLGKKHHAIAQLCTSLLECEPSDKEIATFRHKAPAGHHALEIPAQDLTRLGWKYLHPATRSAILTDAPNKMPQMHLVAWVSDKHLHLHCPHQNPAWMSPDLCQTAPIVAPISLDAEVPLLMPGEVYTPTPEDGLACVEVSDASKQGAPQSWDFDRFAYNLWIQSNGEDDAIRFFEAGTKIAVGDGCPIGMENLPRCSEAMIQQQLGDIVTRLWAKQGWAAIQFMRQTARRVRIGL